ncbi:hypothetical protein GCM10010191_74160 [Actinomadura vinacea]|uniref:Uncharacterized protein n=1 Tax=Actinomadura vinacea TaxID=115336 RepID=A0ABP5X5Y3_9ACTN
MIMKRVLPALIAGALLALAVPVAWRRIARTTRTQVHRVNQ